MACNEAVIQDLNKILREVADTQGIKNFELKPNTDIIPGDGFISQFFTGEIQNKDTGESISVAIKKAPTSVEEFDYQLVFGNEEIFYKKVFPALNNFQKKSNVSKLFDNVPKYFCGSMNPKKEYVAMENLKLQGYDLYERSKPFDQEHLKFIFKTYGKFHALSFVLRKKIPEKYQEISKDLADLLPALLESVGKHLTLAISATVSNLNTEKHKKIYEEIKDFKENVLETFLKASKYNGDYSCMLHGDCWSNNMFFKYSESGELLDMKLIDFQIVRDDTPVYDLSYFFYSGASKEDIDNIEYYLKIYYNSFTQFAKELGATRDELFSFETFVKEWKENALLGIMFGIWLWQVKLVPKEELPNVIGQTAEQTKKWEAYLEEMYKTDRYKEKTSPILIHAVEYGILTKDKIVRK